MDREVINPSYELDLRPEEDVDFEFLSPNQFVGPNVGLIPLQNAVQPTRLFYGARFANQAQPLVRPEAPWVQTATDDAPDTSFDDMLGKTAGALRADQDATVEDVTDQQILLRYPDGKQKRISLYRNMPFNRYSGITQTPTVKKGQAVKANALLARSNFTDENGSLALGLNARIGVVPFKGFSMDDAMVVSDAFAKRATSLHLDSFDKDFSTGNLKGGQDHFKSLFPDLYTRDQLATLDANGVVQPGQVVQPGDPLVLASRPRNFNSAQSQSLGRLGKVARQLRADASLKWESDVPGTVTDVIRKKDGTVRVMIESHRPMMFGDKAVLRSGQKGVVSKIIPEHEMPRTASGEPLDMLLNQQGLPSRANPSLLLEILLGKVAAKTGKPLKIPAFNPEQDSWIDFVAAKLKEAGMTDKETVYDPKDNRKLDRPITVGNAYVLKLHHIAEHKYSARGQGAYDAEGQPSKGPGDGGGAKRRSGLESNVMLSSGAYKNLRESSTLTGQQSDDFWRTFRSGQTPKAPGRPFVFDKFRALLNGAGMHAQDKGGGKLRLGLLTDKQFEQFRPLRVQSGETIDFRTQAPKPGGLFDPALVANKNWGYIDLPEPMPNPAAEDTIRQLLGLTGREFEEVLAGTRAL